ncbi:MULTISPECIES: aminotransferase [Lactococcus]|jgi:aspartate/methionine/tyrosine aminotransferase|uniref:aminotransferase n=1 Tax=Lactococcus TaxID=1357 RepID=UPI00109D2C48|nr:MULTISPECIES: aminotransferase [Lactococcus]MCA2381862.1 aminotransferase [Lactococcus sp. SK2-659]MCI2095676.1 aminotransferase [Lactococcus lactis]MCI2140102.1 aminotransferase [Lactococcus lactis]MCI2188701.1 aminotransferase [Lactococcus lactis]THA53660.1 aminotransferase [Lactococcus lactis]
MELVQFGCEDWLNVWEKSATIDIAQSTIDSLSLEEVLAFEEDNGEAFMLQMMKEKFSYGWIEGSPAFKSEVAKLYKRVPEDNILSTNGATGANFLTILGLIGQGDHVIAQYPSYQQLYDWPKTLGAQVDYWHIKEENNWLPQIEELRRLVKSNTKLICLNNAAQPTGAIMSPKFLSEVVEIARSVDAYILCDEVYLPLDEETPYSPIADLYEKGISTNSISKTYSVPGIRVGWVATQDRDLCNEFRKIRDYTLICTGVFDDAVAALVLKHKDKVLERARKIVKGNLSILKEWVENEPLVSMVYPNAVSVSFVKFEELDPTKTEDFAIQLLREKGVLIIPGNRFDLPGYGRIGYCTDETTLRQGLKLLSEFLREYQV